jgi:hypothetical protein
MGELSCFRTLFGASGLRSDAFSSEQPRKRLEDLEKSLGSKPALIWTEGCSGLEFIRCRRKASFATAPDYAPTPCIWRLLSVTARSEGDQWMLLKRKIKGLLSGICR